MAFISVGAVLSAAAFVFGPFVGTLLKDGFDYLEKKNTLKGRLEHKTPDSEAPEDEQ